MRGIDQISRTMAGVALQGLFARYVHQFDIIEPNHFLLNSKHSFIL